jgi:hypothetical protein
MLLIDVAVYGSLGQESAVAHMVELVVISIEPTVRFLVPGRKSHFFANNFVDDSILAIPFLPKSDRAVATLAKRPDRTPICPKWCQRSIHIAEVDKTLTSILCFVASEIQPSREKFPDSISTVGIAEGASFRPVVIPYLIKVHANQSLDQCSDYVIPRLSSCMYDDIVKVG